MDQENKEKLTNRIRNWFYSQGNGTVARIQCNINPYYNLDFIEKCIKDIDSIIIRYSMGDEISNLEKLAIDVLVQSAYIEDFKYKG